MSQIKRRPIYIALSLVLATLIAISVRVFAVDTGGYSPIAKIWAWADYAGGAVLIQLETSIPECPGGYWFKDSSGAASQNMLAIALSAYHAKTPVKIHADENSDWTWLASKECELKLIILE